MVILFGLSMHVALVRQRRAVSDYDRRRCSARFRLPAMCWSRWRSMRSSVAQLLPTLAKNATWGAIGVVVFGVCSGGRDRVSRDCVQGTASRIAPGASVDQLGLSGRKVVPSTVRSRRRIFLLQAADRPRASSRRSRRTFPRAVANQVRAKEWSVKRTRKASSRTSIGTVSAHDPPAPRYRRRPSRTFAPPQPPSSPTARRNPP